MQLRSWFDVGADSYTFRLSPKLQQMYRKLAIFPDVSRLQRAMKRKPQLNIEVTPEMAKIIERMRGRMSAQAFLETLLRVADTGIISKPPEGARHSARAK